MSPSMTSVSHSIIVSSQSGTVGCCCDVTKHGKCLTMSSQSRTVVPSRILLWCRQAWQVSHHVITKQDSCPQYDTAVMSPSMASVSPCHQKAGQLSPVGYCCDVTKHGKCLTMSSESRTVVPSRILPWCHQAWQVSHHVIRKQDSCPQ